MAKIMNDALFTHQKGSQNDEEEDQDQPQIELSHKAQRTLEAKLFQLLTNAEILEDIEIIIA